MLSSKRGQQFGLNTIFLVLIVGFLIIIGLFTLIKSNEGAPLGDALSESFSEAGDLVVRVVSPIASVLLGLDRVSDANIQFLMIMTFILVLIVIVAALDTASIFGEARQGHLLNIIVGAIITIIGIRFMPTDLWSSLTAPSSAFIAVLLLALPFAALFALSMKWKSHIARKALWLLYIVFVGFIIGDVARSPYLWAYVVFLVLAVIMLFFDSTVRRYLNIEKGKLQAEAVVSKMNVKQRYRLRREIENWEKIKADTTATPADRAEAERELDLLKRTYGDISFI